MTGIATITCRAPGREPRSMTIDQDVMLDRLSDVRESASKPRDDPPSGSMVVRSGDVERVARRLRDRFPETFGHLDQWAVLFGEDANPPKKGCKARARTTIVPPVYQQLYGDDLLVLVGDKWWETADTQEREAALFHALAHVWTATDPETGETIGLRTASHQVEAFHDELAHFGTWHPELRVASGQLALFADSGTR